MFEVVSDVRQQRASRLQFGDVGQRLLDVQVRGVRLVAQRVDDQKIEAAQFLQRLVRNQVAIGDERGASASVVEAKACDFAFAVNDRDRRDSQPAGFELSFDHVRNELRQTSADVFALEDVREDAPQTPPRALARVYRNGAAPEIDRANVVEAEDVVDMAMCDQQRVEPVDLFAQRLLAKIGRNIDDHATLDVFDSRF